MQDIDEAGLDQLRLGQVRRDPQDGFVLEKQRPLRHRVNVAAEAQDGEIVDQTRVEAARLLKPIKLVMRETQRFQKIKRLFEPCGHEELALRRQLANKELKNRSIGLT